MPGRTKITLLACLCAAVVAGCGSDGDGTIPPENAQTMIALLDGVESNAQGGSCDLAQDQAVDFRQEVAELPAEVDREVKQGLFEAADNLVSLAQEPDQCTGQGATLEPGSEPTTSSTTTSSTTTTTTTESSTTDIDEETTPPPTDGGDDEGDVVIEPPAGGQAGGTGGDPPSGGIGGERNAGDK